MRVAAELTASAAGVSETFCPEKPKKPKKRKKRKKRQKRKKHKKRKKRKKRKNSKNSKNNHPKGNQASESQVVARKAIKHHQPSERRSVINPVDRYKRTQVHRHRYAAEGAREITHLYTKPTCEWDGFLEGLEGQ